MYYILQNRGKPLIISVLTTWMLSLVPPHLTMEVPGDRKTQLKNMLIVKYFSLTEVEVAHRAGCRVKHRAGCRGGAVCVAVCSHLTAWASMPSTGIRELQGRKDFTGLAA